MQFADAVPTVALSGRAGCIALVVRKTSAKSGGHQNTHTLIQSMARALPSPFLCARSFGYDRVVDTLTDTDGYGVNEDNSIHTRQSDGLTSGVVYS